MSRKFRTVVLQLCFVMLSIHQLFASDPPKPEPFDQPALPIDGGLIYLVLSAVGFGIYAVRKKN